MNAIELLDIINTGETSKVQFKEKITSPDKFAAEIVAMANSLGGMILIGVRDKSGDIIGLTADELHDYGTKIANIATGNVVPVVFVTTEIIPVEFGGEKKKILIVNVSEGVNKPYKVAKTLKVYVKQGDTKRQVSDNAEMLRLFQQGGNLLADEMEIPNTSIKDVNIIIVEKYIKKLLEKTLEETELELTQLLNNINIIRNNRVTLGGLLFFGKNPQQYKPAFCIKAVSFFGNSIGGKDYRESIDIQGTIPELFDSGLRFFRDNLKHTQQGQNFNLTGILEISQIAIEELLQNALVHRDYFRNAPIRLLIFDNRIEIISPGRLPNSLTVENIKLGNAVARNNLLVSYCSKIMIYRGIGSGITRALNKQPDIEFINDLDGEQFVVKIPRSEIDN
ncbi:MAG: putative DNA binding domain-containing protein [Candidatus Cloacimonadota bacterium]|nr:putative DNA binding domain-containing protein [Candidatus Cloacimonadota bacterium]